MVVRSRERERIKKLPIDLVDFYSYIWTNQPGPEKEKEEDLTNPPMDYAVHTACSIGPYIAIEIDQVRKVSKVSMVHSYR
jgi:hypothetical protein